MLISNSTILDSTRLTRIIQDQATRYQQTLPLRFLNRLIQVPADDDEILMNLTNKNYAADIIADDQAAPVYDIVKMEFVTNVIPNLKFGSKLTQAMINRLNRIEANVQGVPADQNIFLNWERQFGLTVIRNIAERANWLAACMYMDSMTYNRYGVKISANWGMPSDLKATSGTLWSAGAAATPITDILTMKVYAANTYGEVYDRLTLSTADLLLAYATTEFKSLIAGLTEIAAPLAGTAFGTRDARNPRFFAELLQMEVVVEDKTLNEIGLDGTVTTSRALPLGKIILDSSADDRNPAAADFANAIVTESSSAALTGVPYNFPGGETYGPISFYTPASHDLNPPGVMIWGVQRGMPRRHRRTMSAVLTVQ